MTKTNSDLPKLSRLFFKSSGLIGSLVSHTWRQKAMQIEKNKDEMEGCGQRKI
jgi:hypothetical protein